MSEVKVFGHLVPDTDATCAAIVYAWYLTNHKHVDARPYVLGNLNKEAEYVLNRFGHTQPRLLTSLEKDEVVVVVDTNNPEELLSDFSNASILEIVDHHKLAGIKTASPVTVTLRPVACTCTIIWQIMAQENHTDIPEDIASLMLSSILSDTLNFTSPTVTAGDKDAAQALALLAKVEPNELANAMFEAKSDISGMTAKELIKMDGKVAILGDKKILLSVIETTRPGNVMSMHGDLVEAMQVIKKEDSLDGLFFFIVDILTSSSQLIVPSTFEQVVAEKGFEAAFEGDVLQLPGVVSRKKQMVPMIQKGITG